MTNASGPLEGATAWTPHTGTSVDDSARAEVSHDVAATFADLASASATRAAARPSARPGSSPGAGAGQPAEALGATLPAPRTSTTTRASADAAQVLPAPSPSLEAAAFGLGTPDKPGFSPDGRYWYDGARWTRVETDAPSAAGTPRRRRGLVLGLVALVLVLVVLPLGAVLGLPAILDQRTSEHDAAIKQALAYTHLAEQNHQVQTGMYTTDLEGLQDALRAPLLPEDSPVELTVLRASVAEYCAAAGLVGEELRFYVDETGTVGRRACA